MDNILLIWGAIGVATVSVITAVWAWMRSRGVRMTIAEGMDLLRGQDFSSRLIPVGHPEGDRIVDMFNDMMTSLKEERLKVREQNHLLDLLIAASPMGILIFDGNDRLTLANRTAREMLGTEEDTEDERPTSHRLPGELGRALGTLAKDETETFRMSDGRVYRCSRLSFMDKGYPHPFILMEQLTEEVVKAERRGYEKVIRMMAHEVNNSMAAVGSLLDTTAQITTDDDIREAMRICMKRCGSMTEFVTSLADVVKIPEANKRQTDINDFINGILPVLEGLCAGKEILLHYEAAPEGTKIPLDPVLTEQALINIVKNSAESIGKDGEIRIEATGKGITVTDNGGGISPEAEGKLFTPFYSSKADGRGIGLMLISEILKKNGWRFSLRTEEDGKTRFRIEFR